MSEILEVTTDYQGREVVVHHDPQLVGSRAFSFFLRQYTGLMEAGFAIPRSNWTEELCGIIYATIDDVIVGSITYQTGNDGLLLLMSGVDTNQRQNGIFKILNVHFENMARRLNRKFIFSTVHVDNKVRLLTAKKTNFNPIYRLITKIL